MAKTEIKVPRLLQAASKKLTAAKKPATAKSGATKSAPARGMPRTKRISPATRKGTIEDAVELAVASHRGQMDKYRQPYILHVIGVAGRCRSIDEKIVAFLHDVVEDTDTTLDDLRGLGFSEPVVQAVDCLTRRKGETYEAFVERVAPNPLARAVKLADLEDNMDIRRSNRPMKEKDAERMEKYRKAWQLLANLHAHGG